jgi:hypothetical protein
MKYSACKSYNNFLASKSMLNINGVGEGGKMAFWPKQHYKILCVCL